MLLTLHQQCTFLSTKILKLNKNPNIRTFPKLGTAQLNNFIALIVCEKELAINHQHSEKIKYKD